MSSNEQEPVIIVNGVVLTEAQAMIVRIAVTEFHCDVNDPEEAHMLGPIADGYRRASEDVLAMMFKGETARRLAQELEIMVRQCRACGGSGRPPDVIQDELGFPRPNIVVGPCSECKAARDTLDAWEKENRT